jgi:hypothetical protein
MIMARYKKADNCGPVGYPDQSGRYLGEGEVAENDENNDWAPLVALGFVVETGGSVTPDVKESPAEMVAAVEPPPMEPAPEVEAAPVVEEKPKSRRSKRKKKEGVSDGMRSANDGAGAEEVDSSASGESDS